MALSLLRVYTCKQSYRESPESNSSKISISKISHRLEDFSQSSETAALIFAGVILCDAFQGFVVIKHSHIRERLVVKLLVQTFLEVPTPKSNKLGYIILGFKPPNFFTDTYKANNHTKRS